jgi:hypothetical protein
VFVKHLFGEHTIDKQMFLERRFHVKHPSFAVTPPRDNAMHAHT